MRPRGRGGGYESAPECATGPESPQSRRSLPATRVVSRETVLPKLIPKATHVGSASRYCDRPSRVVPLAMTAEESDPRAGIDSDGHLRLSNRVLPRMAVGVLGLFAVFDVAVSLGLTPLILLAQGRAFSGPFVLEVMGLEGVVCASIALLCLASYRHFGAPDPLYLGPESLWGYLPESWSRGARRVRTEIVFPEIRYFSRWAVRGPAVYSGRGSIWAPKATFRSFVLTPENFDRVYAAWTAWKAQLPAPDRAAAVATVGE